MQQQFLDVIDRDEAERRFHAAIDLVPLGDETVPLHRALGRVLAQDIVARVDVPSFDRSNYDGFAVQAADTFGASEEQPRRVRLLDEVVATAVVPETEIFAGQSVTIATGGMVPRGADAIVMVEHADVEAGELVIRRAVTPGFGVSFAGADIAAGETVLRRGETITSREAGVLAAIGAARVSVRLKPLVGIISTGDEIIPPDQPMQPGMIYDSNGRIIADAVCEIGGQPIDLGIVGDDRGALRERIQLALETCDVIVLSGGTSKGAGDISYHIVREMTDPGIVAHGVALKPGKPICLAASGRKPVVILPGFPTSAIFTFHEFVAPVVRRLAGLPDEMRGSVTARMAVKVNSEIGRTEYLLVGLIEQADTAGADDVRLSAYPMGKGSGSVTTFSRADGFVTIGRHDEIVDAGTTVQVRLLGRDLQIADLVVIGSHCIGLDFLLGRLQDTGFRAKFLAVGSTAGLQAVERGECDLAGVHLLDSATGEYNRPFLTTGLTLIPGYGRMQGIVYRAGDSRFEDRSVDEVLAAVTTCSKTLMVNRNQGSGTRILIDRLLGGAKPPGYSMQSRSHNAVAAAVAQGRADWGVAICVAARQAGLGFLPLSEEQFDFVVRENRCERPAVQAFMQLLQEPACRAELEEMGFGRQQTSD